jgi:methylated-DNA-[protein]-cysteine S-methyltransferase
MVLQGTPFQQRVWALLLEIPFGQTVTYGALAKKLGCKSAQAVGVAVGKNPISILIPCHRVVGADGSLTGYAGGLDCKRWLLEHENDVVSRQL